MTIETLEQVALQTLQDKATRLRIDSVRSTTEAGSGHPTSCASAAEIMSVLFYSVMRYDPRDPHRRDSDVFVLSKGHAAPILYAAWAEAGAFPREKLLTLRKVDSDLEGHPTPRLPFVDVATGSLGQGLSVAAGIAINAKQFENSDQRVYVLMGDGESAEGSVWEAAQWAAHHRLNNLCATIDINRLGQSQPTMLEWDLEIYKARWEAFGWQVLSVDGHSIPELLTAYETASRSTGGPTIVLARTLKGKGFIGIEGLEHWHGKALPKDTAAKVISELEKHLTRAETEWKPKLPPARTGSTKAVVVGNAHPTNKPPYLIGGEEVATRRGFGDSLAALAKLDTRIVVLDGDVKNSTYTEEFENVAPNRFFQGYIAEQNIVGVAMGLAARGKVPVAAIFSCFVTRAYDFIRLAAISKLNIKLVGTHCGVSIGEDGPSQMGLEDLAMMCAEPDFTVLYPADATSAWKATALIVEKSGPCYLRLGRPKSKILYGPNEEFEIGKCKVLRKSDQDRALIIAGGITVFEALAAHDQLQKENISVRLIDLFSVQPIDREELIASARAAGRIVVTVEDHYEHGGLGDAVLSALAEERVQAHKLAVREIAHSGKAAELIEKYGISSGHIVNAVKSALAASRDGADVAGFKKSQKKSPTPAIIGKNIKPTQQLHDLGQSLWLDNITRGLLTSGTLRRYIDKLSITGLTSNPSIFDHAIKNSNFYDDAIRQKMKEGKSGEALFFELALEDLRQAADLFRPVYDQTNGTDGWVSMEVSPLFAHDTAQTISQTKQLSARGHRPNLFIKIPGTHEGVPAIEESIFAGVPVNVTLLFSSEQYVAAAEAYMRGIERRIEAGLNPNVCSVASLFISRWDKATMGKVSKELQNHLGIAVAHLTYKAYRQLLDTERWQRLANAGARPQRLLWASTGTKDPSASDVLYIRALAAPFTINTIPNATLLAFADHGELGELMPVDGGDAEKIIAKFGKAGIDHDQLANDLQREGAESFVKSWNELLGSIASKNVRLKATG